MTPSCPSDLRLEAYILSPARSGVRRHVRSCEACDARLGAMYDSDVEFGTQLYVRTVGAVLIRFQQRQVRTARQPSGQLLQLVAALRRRVDALRGRRG